MAIKRGCDTCKNENACHHTHCSRLKKNCKYYSSDVRTSHWEYKGDKPMSYYDKKMRDLMKKNREGSHEE